MRKPLSSEAPGFAARPLPTRSVLADLSLTVVTPMFGGGVEPGVIDESQIIRPSAIRGHLRFWWRVCNAARFASLEAMHREERLLWGSATKKDGDKAEEATWGPGLIGIHVTQKKSGQSFTPTQQTQYVTWPFQQDDPQDGQVGVTFNLRLTVGPHAGKPLVTNQQGGDLYPDVADCEEAAAQALWAWIAFGGVGSRTRRGCGSLYCTGDANGGGVLKAKLFQPPAGRETLIKWLRQRIEGVDPDDVRYVSAGSKAHPFAMLAGCRIAMGKEDAPRAVWEHSIERYKTFVGGLNKSPIRGELGLPRAKVRAGHDRMASPVVLKPLAVSATRAVSLALLLRAPLAGIASGQHVRDDFVNTLIARGDREVMSP